MKSLADKYLPAKFLNELDRILNGHNGFHATRKKGKASSKTRIERASFYRLAFAQLFEMGYRLASPRNLGSRHIEMLVQRWYQEGIANITLHTRVSFLRTFCGWASETPHGGFKQSGFGKDLSAEAVGDYQITKHVMIAQG